jgi:hypothetical protein
MQSGLSDAQIEQAIAYAQMHGEEVDRDIFENVDRFAVETDQR